MQYKQYDQIDSEKGELRRIGKYSLIPPARIFPAPCTVFTIEFVAIRLAVKAICRGSSTVKAVAADSIPVHGAMILCL